MTVITAGDAVALTGLALDAEDGDLTASILWASSRNGVLGIGGTITPTLSPGTHTITATVTDRDGRVGTKQIAIVVDARPTIRIDSPASGTTLSFGIASTLSATATDAEEGNLGAAVTWTSSLDGSLGQGHSITTSSLRAGTHTITATVADRTGRS